MALGMTYNGADGTTRDAMQQTLELAGMNLEEINESYQSLIALLTQLDPLVQFQIANSIWYREDYPVKEDFLDRNRTYFNATVEAMDFASPDALSTINNWVDDNTNGKIDKIVDRLEPNLVMLLINAIYFKGNWTHQFDKNKTRDGVFHNTESSTVSCRMMEQEGEHSTFTNGAFTAVDLPYGDGLFSMTIILPHRTTELDSLLAELTTENWQIWMNSFHTSDIPLYMPKFKLEYELKLNEALGALGMEIAFTKAANFNNMYDDGQPLYIDEVHHKTFVDVNEEGTEAAAVTSVGITVVGFSSILINRPFIFAIRENTSGTLLFLGRIVEPQAE